MCVWIIGKCMHSTTCVYVNWACGDELCSDKSPGLFVQVGELEKREVKASEELDGLRSEVGFAFS